MLRGCGGGGGGGEFASAAQLDELFICICESTCLRLLGRLVITAYTVYHDGLLQPK